MIDHSLNTAMEEIFKTSLSVDELLFQFEEVILQSILFQYPKELALAIKTIIQMEGVITSADLFRKRLFTVQDI